MDDQGNGEIDMTVRVETERGSGCGGIGIDIHSKGYA